MTRPHLLPLLFFSLAACTNEVADPVDPADDSEAFVVSPTTTRAFFAAAGNTVVLRVVDVGNTTAFPKLTVADPAGNVVTSASGSNVAGATFRATSTGTFNVTIADVSNSPPPNVTFALYLAIAPGAHKDGTLTPDAVVSGHIDEGEIDTYSCLRERRPRGRRSLRGCGSGRPT